MMGGAEMEIRKITYSDYTIQKTDHRSNNQYGTEMLKKNFVQ